MRALIIFPPYISPCRNPYLSVPLLVGQLRAANIDAKGLDLNLEFNNDIITKKNVETAIEKLHEIYKHIDEQIMYAPEQSINFRPSKSDYQNKKLFIETLFSSEKQRLLKQVTQDIDEAVKYIKMLPDDDCLPNNPITSTINLAKEIIGLCYYPSSFQQGKNYTLNYRDVKDWAYNTDENIYIEYFSKKVDEIANEKYDFIGVSIPSEEQFFAAFTLLRILKEKTNARILAGGHILYSNPDVLKKHPDFFDTFADEVLVGEGEVSIVQYAHYLGGKLPIEDVSGLIYRDSNGIVQSNEPKKIDNIEIIKEPSYEGYNLDKYWNNHMHLPVQFTKGCYWHKCTFCTAYAGKGFYLIRTPKQAVDIIENMIKKYNISAFQILDDAISPQYFDKFTDEILKRRLKIVYNAFLRLENFTPKLLKKLYKSGLRCAFWGYEAESPRIMELMNKGIDLKERKNILINAHKIGIRNSVGVILGFPNETEEEMKQTVDFCHKYDKYIDRLQMFLFQLRKNSLMLTNLHKYGIKGYTDAEEFSYVYKYDDPIMPKRITYLRQLYTLRLQHQLKTFKGVKTKYKNMKAAYESIKKEYESVYKIKLKNSKI